MAHRVDPSLVPQSENTESSQSIIQRVSSTKGQLNIHSDFNSVSFQLIPISYNPFIIHFSLIHHKSIHRMLIQTKSKEANRLDQKSTLSFEKIIILEVNSIMPSCIDLKY